MITVCQFSKPFTILKLRQKISRRKSDAREVFHRRLESFFELVALVAFSAAHKIYAAAIVVAVASGANFNASPSAETRTVCPLRTSPFRSFTASGF